MNDPKDCPAPGDHLTEIRRRMVSTIHTREVVAVAEGMVIYRATDSGPLHHVTIGQWRKWAKRCR